MDSPVVHRVVGSVVAQRTSDLTTAWRKAKDAGETRARTSGQCYPGRMEDGQLKETKRIFSTRTQFVRKWYTRLAFKHEQRSSLPSDWRDVESQLRQADAPRSPVFIQTHLVRGVRLLQHVRKRYQIELDKTNALLAGLTKVNVELALSDRSSRKEIISQAISALESLRTDLSRKRTAIKRIVASERTSQTIAALEKAFALPEGKDQDLQTARACTRFTAVRDRLGKWRDKNITAIVEFALERECTLRVDRDEWIYGQLKYFAEAPEVIGGYMKTDRGKIRFLKALKKMVEDGASKEELRVFMEKYNQMFVVKERSRIGARVQARRMAAGLDPTDPRKKDFQMAHYEEVYLHLVNGRTKEALKELTFLELFVCANKPAFILRELSKDADSYLAPTLAAFANAVTALNAGEFANATTYFAQAADALATYGQPKS